MCIILERKTELKNLFGEVHLKWNNLLREGIKNIAWLRENQDVLNSIILLEINANTIH